MITDYDEFTGRFEGVIDTQDRGYFTALMAYVRGSEWRLEFGKYFKRPSTGDDSQFHHYWGHHQQLADAFGENIKALDERCRYEFMEQGGDWPIDVTAGQPVPCSLSDERLTSQHMAALVDFVHDFGAIHYDGFEFYEGDHDDRKEKGSVSVFEQKIQRMLRDSAK
jgi:hypothetical protein